MVASAAGFWSYAHDDNDREGGRITRLADLIKAEFALLTGSQIEIFVDRADLKWGVEWRDRIEAALEATTFFIPIITPTFFTRDECRKEVVAFNNAAKSLGLEELILPIRYIPVRDLSEDSADPVKALVARMQYEPWNDVRLHDESDAMYRQGVNRLAQRLVDLTDVIESRSTATTTPPPATPSAANDPTSDDEPGLIDQLASFEPAAEAWAEIMQQFPSAFQELTRPFNEALPEIEKADKQRNSLALRLAIMRRVAQEADGPASRLEELGRHYAERLFEVDPGVRAFISLAEMSTPGTPERDSARESLSSLREMVNISRTTVGQMASVAEAARANFALSRDLRPIFRRVEGAMRSITDAQNIIEEWDRLAEATGVLD